jgi:nitroreductase
MSYFSELAASRRSIRKYTDKDIPLSEIEDLIRTATTAPSGCNSQCWKFVAIKDREVINRIAETVVNKVQQIIETNTDEIPDQYLSSKRKMLTFFTNAPVVVAVFKTRLDFYDPLLMTALKNQGYNDDKVMELFASPDLLTIGAAIQNLLLAVHEKGYGACWMNEPAIAGEEIGKILGESLENKFISLIPIGEPAYRLRDKKLKDFDEIFKSI